MVFSTEDLLKLVMAVVAGGLIGAEREFRDKAAGFRTIIFITIGATLYTMFSLRVGHEVNPTRIAANIVTGIGFLGAGVIMREGGRVAGLTTAATIWLTASLGMGLGAGEYAVVIMATAVILVVLWFFPYAERWIDVLHHTETYELTFPLSESKLEQISQRIRSCSLKIVQLQRRKNEQLYSCSLKTVGKPRNHAKLLDILMADPEIQSVRY
jgi:putative Mg2+ transporter-C (MgtC) family protein